MNTRATAAFLAALALALFVVGAVRRGAGMTPAGRRFFNHPPAAWGLFTLTFFVTVALAAPWVAPYDPSLQLEIVALKNQAPSLQHPLGTDLYSRDVWSRIAYGARVSLSIAALAMLVAVTLGALVGAVAGYMRRWIDTVLMRTGPAPSARAAVMKSRSRSVSTSARTTRLVPNQPVTPITSTNNQRGRCSQSAIAISKRKMRGIRKAAGDDGSKRKRAALKNRLHDERREKSPT